MEETGTQALLTNKETLECWVLGRWKFSFQVSACLTEQI